jgi:hypothetical protein
MFICRRGEVAQQKAQVVTAGNCHDRPGSHDNPRAHPIALTRVSSRSTRDDLEHQLAAARPNVS